MQFKLAVLVYKCPHGTARLYLANELEYTADFEAFDLLPHCHWMSVIHGCPPSVIWPSLFTVRTWNSLSQHVMSAPSMSVFRGRLKAFLHMSYSNFCIVPVQWQLSSSDTFVILFYLLTTQFTWAN